MTIKFYMENSYIRELEAEIIEKKFRNNKYYIKLNRTIFYPHLSGGQPKDLGTINDLEVIDVYEEGEDIVHVLEDNINVTKVKLSINWENRMDLMQQHTGQHLLSAVIHKLYNGETSSFYIGNDYSSIDIDLPNFKDEDIEKIELLANRIIYSNFKIKTYIVNKNDLKNIPLRKKPSVNSNIRIVEIEDFDYSPCGGTHLSSTGEIGIIKIRKWDKKRGNLRIEFLCGNRALHDYSWKNASIREISVLLSSKETDVLTSIKKLYEAKEKLEKENRDLRENLYKLKGDNILNEIKYSNGIGIIYKELEDMDFKELNLIANYLNTKEHLIQIYGLHNGKKAHLFVSCTKDLDLDLSQIFKSLSEKYEIKGGGNSTTVQGGVKADELSSIMKDFANCIIKKLKVRIP
ncbi:MAG: DHHA1 domain-containing protein [Tissierellia bacterium]|nr:DHHA1 domain-containing protein [Tissierellia bacterium]